MKQDQNFHLKLNKSRSGQAVVEYVLVLVIIVGMVMALGKVFKTVNEGMQLYIGDYFACLMEYGELPSLGVSVPELKKHTSGIGKTCDNKFQAFSFSDGRPPTSSGSSGSKSGSGSSGSASSNKKDDSSSSETSRSSASADSNKKSSGDGTEGGAGNLARGKGGSGSSEGSPYQDGKIQRTGATYGTIDGSQDDSKTKILDDDETSKSGKDRSKRRRSRRSGYGENDNYRAISGRALQELEKNIKGRTIVRKPTSSILKIDEEAGVGPHKKTFTPPVLDKVAQKEDRNDSFSFAGMLRWLIIAGMIVAIVIFFGGQLLNYSNSDS